MHREDESNVHVPSADPAGDIHALSGSERPEPPRPRATEPHRSKADTSRWLLGRVAHVSTEATCGFIRGPSGELLYFTFADLAPTHTGPMRAGARVRFQHSGGGIPRATHVQRL